MFTGFRFRREINVLPWLKLNISKTGVSATVGPKAAHVTVGPRGTYVYMDVPGKGTYFRRKLDAMIDNDEDKKRDTSSDENTEDEKVIQYGFLQRLVADPVQNSFVEALEALNEDNPALAYEIAREEAFVEADGAFLAGFLAMKHNEWERAVAFFERALHDSDQLGELFTKLELDFQAYLPVSEEFVVALQPTRRDCLLALAVSHERLNQNEQAIEHLQEIRKNHDPDDLIVRLLLAELLDTTYADHPRVQHEIVTLAEGLENDAPLHAALMYYRAKALRRLGLLEGARDTLNKALRKKKNYPTELLAALQYERALIYLEEGDQQRAHSEFEKIYAMAPELADVAQRLGIAPKINQPPPTGPLTDQTVDDTQITTPVEFDLENLNE